MPACRGDATRSAAAPAAAHERPAVACPFVQSVGRNSGAPAHPLLLRHQARERKVIVVLRGARAREPQRAARPDATTRRALTCAAPPALPGDGARPAAEAAAAATLAGDALFSESSAKTSMAANAAATRALEGRKVRPARGARPRGLEATTARDRSCGCLVRLRRWVRRCVRRYPRCHGASPPLAATSVLRLSATPPRAGAPWRRRRRWRGRRAGARAAPRRLCRGSTH